MCGCNLKIQVTIIHIGDTTDSGERNCSQIESAKAFDFFPNA